MTKKTDCHICDSIALLNDDYTNVTTAKFLVQRGNVAVGACGQHLSALIDNALKVDQTAQLQITKLR